MPFFPEDLMPLTPKEDAPGTTPPDNPVRAEDYNRHDEEIRAIQEFLLERDEGTLNERVLDLVDTANAILRGDASRTLSGYALSGMRPRFPRAKFSFLKSSLAKSDTTIVVDSTEGFPDEGLLTILNDVNPEGVDEGIEETPIGLSNIEWIRYAGKTSDSFLNCERGYLTTSIGSHAGVHLPPNPSQPNCPTTPLQTIRPLCQPPLLIPTYVFPFFGFNGEQEEIEKQIIEQGVKTYFPTNTDFEAFRIDAMGSLGPPGIVDKFASSEIEIVATIPTWTETWRPDWSRHTARDAGTESAVGAERARFELTVWGGAGGVWLQRWPNRALLGSREGGRGTNVLQGGTGDSPIGPISAGTEGLSFFITTETPKFFPKDSLAYTGGLRAVALGLGLWEDTEDGTGGVLRNRLRVRRKRSLRRRAFGRSRYYVYNTALSGSQAASLIEGMLALSNGEEELVRPVPEWSVSRARFESEDVAAQGNGELTAFETLDIFLAAVQAGLVRYFRPSEQTNLNKPGVPVFAGRINVSHELASWSSKREGIDSPRIVQYADGTVFCFLGEDNTFVDVGQSVVAYATWLVKSGI
jgi:hypothetical protein